MTFVDLVKRVVFRGLIAAMSIAWAQVANADLTDAVNGLRAKGCSGGQVTATKLRQTRALDAVAETWSKGGRLQQALEKTGYRALNSSSMRLSGPESERDIVGMLAQRYCANVTNASFTEIGIARRGRDTWIVVAAPLSFPNTRNASAIAREVLTLVNEARAKPRRCGGSQFAATHSLTLSSRLTDAAQTHATDMARHSHFEHSGIDGSAPAERATRAGYRWRNVAENIAAGAPDAQSVVAGWLDSPGHCANIMSPQYREMGVAFAVNPKSAAGIYWAQTFGTAR